MEPPKNGTSFGTKNKRLKYVKTSRILKICLKKAKKYPSPPFTRNYLTHKTLNKKVKGEGLKTLFYIYARQGKKSVFSFF